MTNICFNKTIATVFNLIAISMAVFSAIGLFDTANNRIIFPVQEPYKDIIINKMNHNNTDCGNITCNLLRNNKCLFDNNCLVFENELLQSIYNKNLLSNNNPVYGNDNLIRKYGYNDLCFVFIMTLSTLFVIFNSVYVFDCFTTDDAREQTVIMHHEYNQPCCTVMIFIFIVIVPLINLSWALIEIQGTWKIFNGFNEESSFGSFNLLSNPCNYDGNNVFVNLKDIGVTKSSIDNVDFCKHYSQDFPLQYVNADVCCLSNKVHLNNDAKLLLNIIQPYRNDHYYVFWNAYIYGVVAFVITIIIQMFYNSCNKSFYFYQNCCLKKSRISSTPQIEMRRIYRPTND